MTTTGIMWFNSKPKPLLHRVTFFYQEKTLIFQVEFQFVLGILFSKKNQNSQQCKVIICSGLEFLNTNDFTIYIFLKFLFSRGVNGFRTLGGQEYKWGKWWKWSKFATFHLLVLRIWNYGNRICPSHVVYKFWANFCPPATYSPVQVLLNITFLTGFGLIRQVLLLGYIFL